jgi:GTP-binding protein
VYTCPVINFKNCAYIISCPDYSYRPKDALNEIVLVGRSNVGKSTLINELASAKVAFASKNAGKTKYLNYFLVDKTFYFVDAPGYGYTAYGSKEDEAFATMMEGYFANPQLRGVIFLLDARRDLSDDDRTMAKFLRKRHLPSLLVFTKCDKANQQELALCRKNAEKLGFPGAFYCPKGESLLALKGEVASLVA